MKETTKEQRHNWSTWATPYHIKRQMFLANDWLDPSKCFQWSTIVRMVRHLTQFARSCYISVLAKFMLDLVMSKTRSETATPFSQKPLNRSTSCFAKRYHSVSFSPARATIPQQKIEITFPIQSLNLIRLKELKFGSSRNNFRETKCLSLHNKTSRVYFEYRLFAFTFIRRKTILLSRGTQFLFFPRF